MPKKKRMLKYHQQAEQLVRRVIEDLQRLLPCDGEDISYYNPCVVDTSILDLAKVRTLLGRADEAKSGSISHEVRRKPGVPSRQQMYEILKARSLQIQSGEAEK